MLGSPNFNFLAIGISMSVRTLKRRLRTLNLKRHKGATDTDIQEALTTEIELHGNRRGNGLVVVH